MDPINGFLENFKTATEGLNLLAKILIALILILILLGVIFAIAGVIPEILHR